MPIKILLLTVFVMVAAVSNAQQTKITQLKPIHHQGFYYYYDVRRVDGGAYALQIPLQSLGDDEINLRYKRFTTLRAIGSVAFTVPVIYSVTLIPDSRRGSVSATTLGILYGAGILAALGFEIAGKHQLKKGIDRYNQLIISPGSASLGASVTYKF